MSSKQVEFIAPAAGERVDKAIVAEIGESLSRAQIQTLIGEEQVTVNGKAVKANFKLKGGETIRVLIPIKEKAESVLAEDIALKVIYEDADLAVIDKPAGMTVHPGVQNETGTLVSALLSRWPEIAAMNIEEKRAGIVHRLDKDTSGLIVIAKNDPARRKLMEQFQAHTIEKSYIALVERKPQTKVGRIDAPIARDPHNRKRMAVIRNGKNAITEYTVIDDDFHNGQALVKLNILTGRTHQIRVHMAFIGCPVVGDRMYGFRKQRTGMRRHFLHATELAFNQPTSGERLNFESPLPAGLQNVLEKLKEN